MSKTEQVAEVRSPIAGDPLWMLLTQRLNLSLPAVVGLFFAVSSVGILGGGAIISYVLHAQANIIRVYDPEHLYYALVVLFIYAPAVWTIYVWQPMGIANTLESLREREVLIETQENSLDTFVQSVRASLQVRVLPVGVVLVLVAGLIVETFVVLPAEAAVQGRAFFWFYDKAYYMFVFVPLWYATAYATFMVAAKAVLSILWFNRLFRTFQVRVHPLDADGVGGFGALGSLALKYAWIAVGLGVIASSMAVERLVRGAGWVYVDSLLLWALYIALTPTCLVAPLWSAHREMVRARDELLSCLSNEFDSTLRQVTVSGELNTPAESAWLRADGLKARHNFIKDTFPTWPVSLSAFRRFGIGAALPLVPPMLSILADVLRR